MSKIKRPLALIGYTFFITGSIILSMPGEYTVVLLALFALFIFIHFHTKKKFTYHLIAMLVTSVAAVVYISLYGFLFQKSIDNISTEKQKYNGYVSSITNTENTGYVITLADENGKDMYCVSVYYQMDLQLLDIVEIEGKFALFPRNRYIFANYSDNIKGRINADSIEKSEMKINSVKYKALTLRKALLDKINITYHGDSREIAASMGYGDKHLISDKVYAGFQAAGIVHVLTVSGFHVGIIVLLLQFLLKPLPIDKRIKNIITAVIILVFMNIIGLTPSIIRSGTVAAVILICSNFGKEQDYITTLAAIGLVCILQNPYITRDIGAMLSYAASTGLVAANQYCIRNNVKEERKTLLLACAALVFTIPVLALADMYATWLTPVFNLLLTPVVSVICILSVATPLLAFVPLLNTVNLVLVPLNNLLIKSLLIVLEAIRRYCSFALVNLSHPAILTIVIAAIVAWFVAHIQLFDTRKRNIFVTAVSIAAFLCYNLLSYNVATVTVFDSGREASFHIMAKGKEYLVLSERITETEAEKALVSAVFEDYEQIYYCPKDFEYYTDYSHISLETINVDAGGYLENEVFSVTSDISTNKKKFTLSIKGCDISFGHGKITSEDTEYYILGNDKPKLVNADEIYIFGNIPSWMEVKNITTLSSDLKIKINLKTGKYKTIKDVYNFGCWL